VAAGARAILDGLTLANGMSSADAGCVLVEAGGAITIKNSMMTNCSANGDGGALYLAEGVTCTILKSVLDNCVAGGSGGGIYMLGSFLWLNQSSIRRSTAGSCTSGCSGGALCANDSAIWMAHASLYQNSAGDQGGAIFANNSQVSMERADVTAGTARIGGGIVAEGHGTTVQLIDVLVQLCAASHHAGGALLKSGYLNVTRNVTFLKNRAADDGGAIRVSGMGHLCLGNHVTLGGNEAHRGGGISVRSATDDLTNIMTGRILFQNNNAGGDGGAISIYGEGNLSFGTSVVFKDNEAAGDGGAMALQTSDGYPNGIITVTINSKVVLENNRAGHNGGGICIFGIKGILTVMTIGVVTFQNNYAGGDGGGLSLFGDVNLSFGAGVVFKDNEAADDGGAMALQTLSSHPNGIITVTTNGEVVLENNRAGDSGGGIHILVTKGILTVMTIGRVTFQNNYAAVDGGGLSLFGIGNLSFGAGVVFKDNEAADNGGAMALQTLSSNPNGIITVTTNGEVVLENNRAGDDGGGIYIFDDSRWANLEERSIVVELRDGAEISACSGDSGGAVWIRRGILIMTRPRINLCRADAKGGALYGDAECKIKITGGSFKDNTAGESGGMAYVEGESHLILTGGVEVFGGHAERGAAVYTDTRSVVDMTNGVTLRDNVASLNGGAVYAKRFSIVTMTDGVILDGNVAARHHGGALYIIQGSIVTMTDDVILRNNHAVGAGGAVYAIRNVMLRLSRNVLCIDNSAEEDSGCVHLSCGSHLVASDNVTFADNSAGDDAGAVSAQSASISSPSFINIRFERGVFFSGNIARDNGGALFLGGPVLLEVHDGVEFVENLAGGNGGVLYTFSTSDGGGKLFISRTLFKDNACSASGGAIYASDDTSLTIGGDVRMQGNLAQMGGGAIYSRDTAILLLSGVIFEDNGASFHVSGHLSQGGALHLAGKTASIHACTFRHNFAVSGGAVLVSNSKVNMTGGIVANGNVAATSGGFMYLRDASVNLGPGTNISLNMAGSGAGVSLNTASMSALDGHVTISNNRAIGVAGGVHLIQGSKIDLVGVQISGNVAGVHGDAGHLSTGSGGAGLYSQDSFVSMTGCRFHNNVAANGGGAVHFVGTRRGDVTSGRFQAKDCDFQSNSGEFGGAIVLRDQGMASFESCNFVENVARSQRECSADVPFCGCGGGIAVLGSSDVHIEKSRFEANRADATYELEDASLAALLEQVCFPAISQCDIENKTQS